MSLSLNDRVLCSALRMFFKVHVKMQPFYQHFLTSDMHRLSKVIHKVVRIIIKVWAEQKDIWYMTTIVSEYLPIFHLIGKHLLLLLLKRILFDMWLLQKYFQIYTDIPLDTAVKHMSIIFVLLDRPMQKLILPFCGLN